MKNIFQYIAIFALLGVLTQCKKGEDDPFLSLRSRKARVAGDWHLTAGTKVSTNSGGGGSGSTTTYNYTESSYTYNYVSGAINTSTMGVYSLKYEFKRDGTFTKTETSGSNLTTKTGVWNFTAGVGKEYKNKQQITLTFLTSTYMGSNSSNNYTYTGKDMDEAFSIKELRNKKMVLVQEYTSASSGGSSNTFKAEYTLEQ